jgi:hypothetical protein
MGTYGRNFEFRVPPVHGERNGRYSVPAAGDTIPIGAPVLTTAAGAADDLGMQPVTLATGAQARPKPGMGGLALYEWAPAAFAGTDQFLTTYSDRDYVPLGAAIQVVSGPQVKVVFTNTSASTFLGTRSYAGRTMVAGMGATPTIAVGDFLTPGTGNDSAGYWAETASEANAWLVVTNINTTRLEVEARFVF